MKPNKKKRDKRLAFFIFPPYRLSMPSKKQLPDEVRPIPTEEPKGWKETFEVEQPNDEKLPADFFDEVPPVEALKPPEQY